MGAANIPAVDHQKAELFPTERTAAIELFANNFNKVFHNDKLAERLAGPRAFVHLLKTCVLQVVPKEFIRQSQENARVGTQRDEAEQFAKPVELERITLAEWSCLADTEDLPQIRSMAVSPSWHDTRQYKIDWAANSTIPGRMA